MHGMHSLSSNKTRKYVQYSQVRILVSVPPVRVQHMEHGSESAFPFALRGDRLGFHVDAMKPRMDFSFSSLSPFESIATSKGNLDHRVIWQACRPYTRRLVVQQPGKPRFQYAFNEAHEESGTWRPSSRAFGPLW